MSGQDAHTSERRGGSASFVAFLLTIIALALLASYAVFMGGAQLAKVKLREWTDPRAEVSLIEIVIDGEARLMRPEAAVALIPGLTERLEERLPAFHAETDARIAAEVDAAFAPALEHVPRFTDWYYSLRGEYSRYLSAMANDLPAFMARKLEEKVIAPSGLEGGLDRLEGVLSADLVQRLQAEQRWALETLAKLVAADSMPRETPQYRGRVEDSVELDAVLRDGLTISEQDLGQTALVAMAATGAGTAVAKGLGAVVVTKLVAKLMGTSGMELAVALLGKVAAKAGVKGGGSAAAAATGLTVCAPGGLIAVVCGVVAGGIVWVLVDKAFVEIEEALDRDAFEADLRSAMIAERDSLKQRLGGAYEGAVRARYAELVKQLVTRTPASMRPPIRDRFVPAAPDPVPAASRE